MSSSDQQIQHGAWPRTAPLKGGAGGAIAIAPRARASLDPIVSLQDTMHKALQVYLPVLRLQGIGAWEATIQDGGCEVPSPRFEPQHFSHKKWRKTLGPSDTQVRAAALPLCSYMGGVHVCVCARATPMVNKMPEQGVPDCFPSCPHKHPSGGPAPWNSRQRPAQRIGWGPRA